MLLVLSEEQNRVRIDMPSDLYAASKEKLNEQIPVILSTLTSLLEKLRQEVVARREAAAASSRGYTPN